MDNLWKVQRSENPKQGWIVTENGKHISRLMSFSHAEKIVKSHNAILIPLLKAEGE